MNTSTPRSAIRADIAAIVPHDALEADHQADALPLDRCEQHLARFVEKYQRRHG